MLVKFIARRLLASVIVVLGVTAVTLFLMDRTRGAYVPGIDLNPALRPEDIARLRADLGLDQPFYQWYVTWLWNVIHGAFGRSMIDGGPGAPPARCQARSPAAIPGTACFTGSCRPLCCRFSTYRSGRDSRGRACSRCSHRTT